MSIQFLHNWRSRSLLQMWPIVHVAVMYIKCACIPCNVQIWYIAHATCVRQRRFALTLCSFTAKDVIILILNHVPWFKIIMRSSFRDRNAARCGLLRRWLVASDQWPPASIAASGQQPAPQPVATSQWLQQPTSSSSEITRCGRCGRGVPASGSHADASG